MVRWLTKAARAMSSSRASAVIGGSGLYQLEGATDVKEVRVKTPFGAPSDAIVRTLIHRIATRTI